MEQLSVICGKTTCLQEDVNLLVCIMKDRILANHAPGCTFYTLACYDMLIMT